MSKIFDALKKSQDQASGPILSSLADDEPASPWGRAAAEQESPADDAPDSPWGCAAAEQAAYADEPVSPWGRAAAEQAAAAAAVVEPEFALYDGDGTGIRTLAIQVPASVPILPFDGAHPAASEQYRLARTKIIQHPRQPRIIQVSSPGPGDGKTITAINLAGALSLKTGGAVLLVDGDFRRSVVHSHLGLPAGPGFAEVLAGSCPLEAALIHVEQFHNLYVLPAGTTKSSPVGAAGFVAA